MKRYFTGITGFIVGAFAGSLLTYKMPSLAKLWQSVWPNKPTTTNSGPPTGGSSGSGTIPVEQTERIKSK